MKRVGLWERSRGVLWRSKADLDGDGRVEAVFAVALDDQIITAPPEGAPEPVEPCASNHRAAPLIVGDAILPLRFIWPKGAYWYIEAPLRIVDLDKREPKKEVWFRQHASHSVDPEQRNTVIRFDGERLVASEVNGRAYSAGTVEFLGMGRIKLLISGCPKEEAYLELRGDTLVQTRVETGPTPAHGCAACPFVYVRLEDRWSQQREILRNVVGERNQGWQRLLVRRPLGGAAPSPSGSSRRSRRSRHWMPCASTSTASSFYRAPAPEEAQRYCSVDGQRHMLRPGDHVDLHFELPVESSRIELEAFGFYDPIARP